MDHSRITYPPLGVPKQVADGVWIVDGAPIRPGPGLEIPTRMTVIRLGSGHLWLHSPVQYSPGTAQALEALGPVRHLVAPNIGHWSFLPDWQKHYPQATLWAAPGLGQRRHVRKSGLRIDHDLTADAPGPWSGEIEQAVIPGAGGFREVAFLHPASRTLVLTDLIANLEPAKLPMPTRLFARLNGMLAPEGRAAIYVRLSVRLRRGEAVRALAPLLDRAPERVVFAHGNWFGRDGAAKARRSLAWLIG